MRRFILNIYGSFFIIIVLFSGCANRNIARKAYNEGDYNTSYSIWKKWADRGYYDAYVELLKILNKNGKNIDYKKIENMALIAYNNGEKQAAFVLENVYINKGDLRNAYLWMQRGDFNLSSMSDFRNHLYIIKNYNIPFMQKRFYLEKIENIAKNNPNAAMALGDFYADSESSFYDLRRSEYFYKKAYKFGNKDAGLALARLYLYALNNEQEGLGILYHFSKNGYGKASYEIANFMLYRLNNFLQNENSSCAAISFNLPHEFYIKKMYIDRYKKVYMAQNVIPWYKKAYKQGYLDGMLKLISLDLQEDNFHKEETYSGMNLEEAEMFLQNHKNSKKAVGLLANLYQNYPELEKMNIAESILLDNMEENSTEAMWKLYKFYKKQNINSPQAKAYLQELTIEGFQPAIIEHSYENILKSINVDQNLEILFNAAKRGDKDAIEDIISLYNKDIVKNIDYLSYLKKACKLESNNKSIDLKIADYYLKNGYINKGATILQYYAQLGDSNAQYRLSKIYGKLNRNNKEIFWLKEAKNRGNIKAEIDYYSMVVKGLIKDDVYKSIQILNRYAKMGNIDALRVLAYAYSNGTTVDFDPQKAKYYYLLLIERGDKNAYFDLINLFQKINVDHRYDNAIEQLFQMAIKNNLKHAKVRYAQFLINRKRAKEAKRVLLSIPLDKEPLAKVLLYQITGNQNYISKGKITNNGKLLLQYAKIISKYSKRKALLYAFRAHLCNTPSSGELTYELMRLINNSKVIKEIYQKAKSYPKCINN